MNYQSRYVLNVYIHACPSCSMSTIFFLLPDLSILNVKIFFYKNKKMNDKKIQRNQLI